MLLGKTVILRVGLKSAEVGIIVKVHGNCDVDICILPSLIRKWRVKRGYKPGRWSDPETTPQNEQGNPDYSKWDK